MIKTSIEGTNWLSQVVNGKLGTWCIMSGSDGESDHTGVILYARATGYYADVYTGIGVWKDVMEPSLLIFGMSLGDALSCAKKFKQRSIIYDGILIEGIQTNQLSMLLLDSHLVTEVQSMYDLCYPSTYFLTLSLIHI